MVIIHNNKKKLCTRMMLLFFFLFFLPIFSYAQINIVEIMYDLEGSDSKGEWIEITNTHSEPIDLSDWRLFENDTNHKLSLTKGDETILPGEFAVIADNTNTFLLAWPQFSGTLFDSSFSLKNTGELFSIRNSDLNDSDSVMYSSDWGAAGDGNSLQKSNNKWISAFPTPGQVNASIDSSLTENNPLDQSNNQNENTTDEDKNNMSISSPSFPIEPQIFAYAGKDRIVTVSADSLFKGKATGLKGEPLEGARYLWNFGDGKTKEGQKILHYYSYPGEYVVVLNVSSGKFSASDRVIVEALPADIIISAADPDFIELENKGDHELNLSWWRLKVGNAPFMIPADTIVLPHKKLIFPSLITELAVHNIKDVILLYPNGVIAYEYKEDEETPVFIPSPPIQQPATIAHVSQNSVTPSVSTKKAKEESVEIQDAKQKLSHSNEVVQASAPLATKAIMLPTSPESKKGISVWLLMLLSIILFAITAAILFKRSAKTDEIKIIE